MEMRMDGIFRYLSQGKYAVAMVVLLLSCIIVALSLIPSKWMWVIFYSGGDHAAAFLLLSLAWRAMWPHVSPLRLLAMLAALGIGIEAVQAFTGTGHRAEWSDVAADLVGAITGIVLTSILLLRAQLPAPQQDEAAIDT